MMFLLAIRAIEMKGLVVVLAPPTLILPIGGWNEHPIRKLIAFRNDLGIACPIIDSHNFAAQMKTSISHSRTHSEIVHPSRIEKIGRGFFRKPKTSPFKR